MYFLILYWTEINIAILHDKLLGILDVLNWMDSEGNGRQTLGINTSSLDEGLSEQLVFPKSANHPEHPLLLWAVGAAEEKNNPGVVVAYTGIASTWETGAGGWP